MAAAEELNEEVTPAEIKEMLAQCDPDGEGVIRLEQFVAFNKRKNFD
jgi:Ca2+-binding EF-hand superfamily protein